MQINRQQATPYIIVVICCVPLFFLNIYPVHSWGDDFALYLQEARNIAAGRPYYISPNVFNPTNPVYSPPQYPPGFPLMLAPIVKIWGVSFTALCYYNSVIMTVLALALLTFFRKYAGVMAAVCMTMAMVYSGIMLELKRNVLADVPSLLFVVLYLNTRVSGELNTKRKLLLVLFAVAAIQIRSQAIFLLAAEVGFMCWAILLAVLNRGQKVLSILRSSPAIPIVAGEFAVNFLLDKVLLPTPLSTSAFYNNFIRESLNGGMLHTARLYYTYVLTTIKDYFKYETDHALSKTAAIIAGNVALALVLIGFAKKVARKADVGDVFFLVMCGVILYYPVRDPRYFLPAAPMLFIYVHTSLSWMARLLDPVQRKAVAGTATALYLLTGVMYFKKAATEITPGCIPQQKEKDAFAYISTNVKNDEIILFAKPRALTLFTNKKTMCISWQISPEQNKRVFDSLGVKYILVSEGYEDGWFKDYLRNVQPPKDSTRIADGYMLYRLW